MTLEFFRNMDIDIKNINKNDKNTWRTIYEEICEPYFGEVKLFPKAFIEHCKKHLNGSRNIPYEINKSIKIIALE